jgi:uncharacterized protein YjiS (DUF1127 family)
MEIVMSAISRSELPARSVLGTTVLAACKRAAVKFGHLFMAWNNRRGLTLLARFDDRALADIGLSRSDVRDALAQPWWNDPTVMLDQRRGERRINRSSKIEPLRPRPHDS